MQTKVVNELQGDETQRKQSKLIKETRKQSTLIGSSIGSDTGTFLNKV